MPISQQRESLVPFGTFLVEPSSPRLAYRYESYPVSTLVIGLGRMGTQAAAHVRTMVRTSFTPEARQFVNYMVITQKTERARNIRDSFRDHCLILDAPDLLDAAKVEIQGVPSRLKREGIADVAEWWPKRKDNALFGEELHPADLRCYGRLLLYKHHKPLNQLIEAHVAELLQRSQSQGADGRRLVILLASLVDADGSSIVTDVARLVKSYLGTESETATEIVPLLFAHAGAVGHGTQSTHGEHRTEAQFMRAKASVYAAMMEIDALMSNPADYSFEMSTGNGERKVRSTQRPFTRILLTADHAPAVPPSNLLAEAAFSMMQVLKRQAQIASPVHYPSEKAEQFGSYTTFGATKVALPTARALELLGGQLAEKVLRAVAEQWSSPDFTAQGNLWAENLQNALNSDDLQASIAVQERIQELAEISEPDAVVELMRSRRLTQAQLALLFIERLQQEIEISGFDQFNNPIPLDSLQRRLAEAFEPQVAGVLQDVGTLPYRMIGQQGMTISAVTQFFNWMEPRLRLILKEKADLAEQLRQAWEAELVKLRRLGADASIARRVTGELRRDMVSFSRAQQTCVAFLVHATVSTAWEHVLDHLVNTMKALTEDARHLATQLSRLGDVQMRLEHLLWGDPHKRDVLPPAIAVHDRAWYEQIAGTLQSYMQAPPDRVTRLIPDLWKQWGQGKEMTREAFRAFMDDLAKVCTHFLDAKGKFPTLLEYLDANSDDRAAKDAQTLLASTLPEWMPETMDRQPRQPETEQIEWVRVGSTALRSPFYAGMLSPAWQAHRVPLPAPDASELCLIRLAHHVPAAALHDLAVDYREAYERVKRDNIPLHIDSRWEPNLPHLSRESSRERAARLLADTIGALGTRERSDTQANFSELLRRPAELLLRAFMPTMTDIQQYVRRLEPNLLSVFMPLPDYRLRIPPDPCLVIFVHHRPGGAAELVSNIIEAFGDQLVQRQTEMLDADAKQKKPLRFAIVVALRGSYDVREIREQLRRVSIDILWLDESRFKSVVYSPQPSEALRQIIIKDVGLEVVSPFHYDGPVKPSMFFGREREIQVILDKLGSNSVAIIGGRRIGKTSIMKRLEKLLNEPKMRSWACYLDCGLLPDPQLPQFQAYFFELLQRRLRKMGYHFQIQFQSAFDLTRLVDQLSQRVQRPLVFLLDEVDYLLENDQIEHREQLFRTFRSLSNENNCQFVFTGERHLQSSLINPKSCLYNFPHRHRLERLLWRDVQQLILEPLHDLDLWPENLVEEIYALSVGHPWVVQRICNEIIKLLNKHMPGSKFIDPRLVEVAVKQEEVRTQIITTFQGNISPLAHLITYVWPADRTEWTFEQISSSLTRMSVLGNLATERHLTAAIEELKLYHFLEDEGKRRYRLIPERFPALVDDAGDRDMKIRGYIDEMRGDVPT